jgi:hypothetical protein
MNGGSQTPMKGALNPSRREWAKPCGFAAFGADRGEGASPLALPRDIYETKKHGRVGS